LIFATGMLNVASLRGLLSPAFNNVPILLYMHENQLTYPDRYIKERDFHFSYTNFSSALCADVIWFNSTFNKNSFLNALKPLLKKMPDYHHIDLIEQIDLKSSICPQGITPIVNIKRTDSSLPNILWAARFEHDKNPEMFFEAIDKLLSKGYKFTISVIGEEFKESPAIFETAREKYKDIIKDFGYQPSRQEYERVLTESDIFVSTADHEFFGVSAVEAISSGAFPLLPEKLAYPEVLKLNEYPPHACYFYKGSLNSLVEKLTNLLRPVQQSNLTLLPSLQQTVQEYYWPNLIRTIDTDIDNIG
jgi:glycosyltransferase involved in cell wall biosynthesis